MARFVVKSGPKNSYVMKFGLWVQNMLIVMGSNCSHEWENLHDQIWIKEIKLHFDLRQLMHINSDFETSNDTLRDSQDETIFGEILI